MNAREYGIWPVFAPERAESARQKRMANQREPASNHCTATAAADVAREKKSKELGLFNLILFAKCDNRVLLLCQARMMSKIDSLCQSVWNCD